MIEWRPHSGFFYVVTYIVPHTQQENFQFYILLTSQQESLETIVIFQNLEGSIYLDRAIHPEHNFLFRGREA